jgi:hypothetical protein
MAMEFDKNLAIGKTIGHDMCGLDCENRFADPWHPVNGENSCGMDAFMLGHLEHVPKFSVPAGELPRGQR